MKKVLRVVLGLLTLGLSPIYYSESLCLAKDLIASEQAAGSGVLSVSRTDLDSNIVDFETPLLPKDSFGWALAAGSTSSEKVASNSESASKETTTAEDKSDETTRQELSDDTKHIKINPEEIVNLLKSSETNQQDGQWQAMLISSRSALDKSRSIGNRKLEAIALRAAAKANFELGQSEEASNLLEKAIGINRELKNARGRALDLILAGQISMSQRDYLKATSQLEEAQKILPSSESGQIPGLLENLSKAYMQLKKFPEALSILNRLSSFYSKNNHHDRLAAIRLNISDAYISKGDFKNAEIELKKAEKTLSESDQPKLLGQTLLRMAYLGMVSGDFKGAQSNLNAAIKLTSTSEIKWTEALQATITGMNENAEGNLDKASEKFTKAVTLLEEGQHDLFKARVKLLLAKILIEKADRAHAFELVSTSLDEFKKAGAIDGEADSEETLAQMTFRQGDLKNAAEHSQKAFDIYRKLKNKDRMVQSRIISVEINEAFGNPSESLKQLKEAIDISKTGIDHKTSNYLRLAVARFRLTRENTDKGLEAALEAKKDFVAMNDTRGIAEADFTIGLGYELGGNTSKAKELLEIALKKHKQIGDRYNEGKDLTALGVMFKNSGAIDRAEHTFDQALELRKSIGDLRGYAANLVNLANIYRRKSMHSKASQNLQTALEIYRQVSDKKGEADALTNLGNLDALDGLYQPAMEKFKLALELHKQTSDIRGIATDLISIGSLHLVAGDIDNGASVLKEAEAYNKRIFNPSGTLAILSETATIHKARRNYTEALAYLNKAMELAKVDQDPKSISSINLRIASVFEEMGDFQKALGIFEQTRDQLSKTQDIKGLAWALGSIGIIQAKMEDYESAIRNLTEANRLRNAHSILSQQSQEIDFYLGEIFQGFKDYDRALDHYHRALSVSQTSGTDRYTGKIYDRIGIIYYRMEDYSKSRDFLEDALRISSENGDTKVQKAQLIRLADVMSKLKDPENSMKYLQKALGLTRDTKDMANESRVLTRIGTMNQVLGRPNSAMENYAEAMDIRTKIGDRRGINENLLQISLVNATLGDFEASVTDLKKALDIAQASEDRSMLWKAYFIMGRTLEERKNFGEALEAYRKSLTIVDRMDAEYSEESEEDDFIFGGTSALFETTLRVLMNLAKKDPEGEYDNQALMLVERLKAASFLDTLTKINVPGFSNIPSDLLLREKSLRLSLNSLNSKLMEQRSKNHPNNELIRKLLKERRKKEQNFGVLKDQLSRDYPAYVNLTKPKAISIHQVQKNLDPEEVLLEYMVTRGKTYIFAIDRYRFHTFSIDYPLSEIDRDVELLIRPLHKHETLASWDPSVAYKIYSKVVKPVEYAMAGKKIVTVIPHGPLCWVPFEILVDSKSHETKRFWSANDKPSYLLEKYTFCYAESTFSLCLYRNKPSEAKPGWNLVAFGDPVFNDSSKTLELNPGTQKLMSLVNMPQNVPLRESEILRPLRETRKEILEISKIVGGPTQTYLGNQATETLFKKADLNRYMYIHLGTYGVLTNGFGRSQQQPAIIFSLFGDKENDGFLQLGEVLGLRLNSDLVVLSSCISPPNILNSSSNGPFDLAKAFLFAGTSSVVLSSWQVNEEHSEKLLLEIYKNLKDDSKAEALKKAQLSLLNSPGTSHPYYWGSYILVGDWRHRFLSTNNRWEPESVGFKGVSTWRKLFNM
ncbi:MAG: tetratricopeptide repeat protein [Pseudomonadota bacterium]